MVPRPLGREDQITAMVSRGPLTLPQIAERLGLSVDNTRVVLLRMLRAGQIARAKDEGQMRWFPRLEVRS